MKPEQEKYILENAGKISTAAIARALRVNERRVKEFIRGKKVLLPAGSEPRVRDPQPARGDPWVSALMIAAMVVVGVLIYSNTFRSSFHLDDYTSIVQNPDVRLISDFSRILRGEYPATFVTYLTFAFNYQFWKTDPFFYHLINTAIHIATSLLVFYLTLLTLKISRSGGALSPERLPDSSGSQKQIAFFAGLVFLCHPVQTEAVSYVVQRITSLATFFYVAALVFYVKARTGEKFWWYVPAVLLGAAGMFTKQIVFTLPFAILLYEFCFIEPRGRGKMKRIYFVIPFVALLAVVYFYAYAPQVAEHGFARASKESADLARGTYFLTELRVLATYLRLLFFPVSQNLDYDYPISRSLLEPKTLLSFLLLAVTLFVGLGAYLKKYRFLAFGIFWFFLTLSVESSVIPIRDVIFEHRLYLPMAGTAVFAAAGLWQLFRNEKRYWLASGLIIVVLSAMTFERNKVWANEFVLWTDVIRKSPNKARPYHSFGLALFREGRYAEALKFYEKAIARDPSHYTSYVNKGMTLEALKNTEEAVKCYEAAVRMNPKNPVPYVNLGAIYQQKGEIDSAINYYLEAIRQEPKNARAHNNLAVAYDRKGDLGNAIEAYRKAVTIDPAYVVAWVNLGISYGKAGDYGRSIAALKQAIGYDPLNANAHLNLGISSWKSGDQAGFLKEIAALNQLKRKDLAAKLENLPSSGDAGLNEKDIG